MDCVNTLTTAIDVSFAYESNKNFSNLYCIVPAGVEYSDVEKIKDTLIAFRQYEITIRYKNEREAFRFLLLLFIFKENFWPKLKMLRIILENCKNL